MSHVPPGRTEVGETVASFGSYEGAQKAVSTLIAGDIPARDIAIVGSGLRSVERVTGKLGYATAARSGAINGVLLGLFFSALFLLGNDKAPPSAFVGVLLVGVALGMLFSLGAYAIVRRRKDFASVMQVIAEHYDVTVLPTSIHRAREVLGAVTTAARPPRRDTAGDRDVSDEPPRYGERIDPPSRPRYGERITPAPRYGERIEPAAPTADDGRADRAPGDAARGDATRDEGVQGGAARDDEAQDDDAQDGTAQDDGVQDDEAQDDEAQDDEAQDDEAQDAVASGDDDLRDDRPGDDASGHEV